MDEVCGICQDTLLLPWLLKCFHHFCQCCIEGVKNLDGVKCIICDETTTFDSVQQLPYHPLYLRTVNSTIKDPQCAVCGEKAIKSCTDCEEEYCELCAQTHSKMKVSKDHVLKSNNAQSHMMMCDDHLLQPQDFYCYECQKLLCTVCINSAETTTKHRTHKILSLKSAAAEYRNKIRCEYLQNISTPLDKLQQSLSSLNKQISEEGAMCTNVKQTIREQTQYFISLLQTREKLMFEEADSAFSNNKSVIDANIASVEEAAKKFGNFKDICTQFECSLTDHGLLQIKHSLEDRCQLLARKAAGCVSLPVSTDRVTWSASDISTSNLVRLINNYGEVNADKQNTRCIGRFVDKWSMKFYSPLIICETANSNVIVVDSYCESNKQKIRVKEVTVEGVVKRAIWACSRSYCPIDTKLQPVVCENGGTVIVGITHNVIIINKSTNKSYKFGKEGQYPGQIMAIAGLAFSSIGNILLTDNILNRISMFTGEGDFILCFGTSPKQMSSIHSVKSPLGIVVDENDTVYVADSGHNRVAVYSHEGCYMKSIGGYGRQPGEFDTPVDVCLNKDMVLAVLDKGNRRIQFISLVKDNIVLGVLVLHHSPKYFTWLNKSSTGRTLSGDIVVTDTTDVYHYTLGEECS